MLFSVYLLVKDNCYIKDNIPSVRPIFDSIPRGGVTNADKRRQMDLIHHGFISQLKTGFHSVLYIQMYIFYLHNNTVILFKKKS